MAKSRAVALRDVVVANNRKRVIFQHEGDVFWLRGAQLAQVSQAGLVTPITGKAIGFFNDGALVEILRRLVLNGYEVAVAEGSALRSVTLPSSPKHKQRVTGRSIGLSPELLEDRDIIERLSSRLTQQPEGKDLVHRLREELSKPSRSQATLYVIQVAETIYEVDWDLTTIDTQTYEALLVAAYLGQRFLRCVLVPPRSKRRRTNRARQQMFLHLSDGIPYGQLRLF